MIKLKGGRMEEVKVKKKIKLWNGIWRELPWLLFIIIMIFSAWAYKRDVGACTDVLFNKTARCDIRVCGPVNFNISEVKQKLPEFNTTLADEVFQPNG